MHARTGRGTGEGEWPSLWMQSESGYGAHSQFWCADPDRIDRRPLNPALAVHTNNARNCHFSFSFSSAFPPELAAVEHRQVQKFSVGDYLHTHMQPTIRLHGRYTVVVYFGTSYRAIHLFLSHQARCPANLQLSRTVVYNMNQTTS